jgi:hypothetical protein
MEFMEINCCWNHTPLRHWWNFGYESESILKIMRHLPPRLNSSMHRLLDTLHSLSEYSACSLQHMSRLASWLPSTEELPFQGDTWVQREEEEAEWEKEVVFALLSIVFDPVTQARRNVRANSRAALLWNMRKSELLLRFANYDLPLPYTELDWLRILILDLREYFQNATSHYHRMMVGSGKGARAMIVCVTKIKTFNCLGRISQVLTCFVNAHSLLV